MANKIQLRRDTTANWNNVNPILADGEPGLDITTNQIKYGDGANAWVDLSYASGGGLTDVDGLVTFPGDLLIGTLFPEDPMPGGDKESVVWAKDDTEYLGLWWGGDQIYPESFYGPVAGIMIGPNDDNSLTDDFTDNASPVGTSIVAAINDKDGNTLEWRFDRDGKTTFPDNTITPVAGNDLAINAANEYQVSSLNFIGTNNSYVLFPGFTVGPATTNSFTIEFFFRLADDPSSIQHAFIGSGATNGLSIYTGAGVGTPNNNTITVDCDGNSNIQFTVPTLNSSWHHLILVRKGAAPGPGNLGAMAMWYDGVRVGSFNDVTVFDGITNSIGMWDATNMHLVGSIAGLRITNTAEYNVDVETYPIPRYVAPLKNGVRLLLRVQDAGNNAYIDSSPYHYALTPGSDTSAGGIVDIPQSSGTYLLVEVDQKWNFGIDGLLTLPNGAQISSKLVNPIINGISTISSYNYDASSLTINADIGDVVSFPGFSGQILINDHITGQVELWLCGGGSGNTFLVGTSKDNSTPDTLGQLDYNVGINGYTWTCSSQGEYVFVATRTRTGA